METTAKYRADLSIGVILESDNFKWVYDHVKDHLRDAVGQAGTDVNYKSENALITRMFKPGWYVPVAFMSVSTLSIVICDYDHDKKEYISRI